MNRKSLSKIILTILFVTLGAQTTAATTVASGMPELHSLALKLFVIIFIFWREKNRMEKEADLQVINERMLAQSVLAKRAAHDIRSPLSALQLIVGTLHAENKEQKQIIIDVVSRINGIANDLLTSEKAELESEEVIERPKTSKVSDIKGLVESLTAEKAALFPDVKFVSAIKQESMNWSGSDVELSRVLSNILNNAIESGADENTIYINAYPTRKFMYVEVIDFGQGISNDVLAKLGKEELTTKGSQGNGIGLYSAFSTVRSWGGDILIQSKLGVGTKVIVKIPVC